MMRAATILRWPVVGLLMLAAPALAQWPSWSRPMEKSFDRGNQALSSAVERLTVSVGPQAWTNYITTNIWASYFSQGSKLKASKNMMKAAVDAGGWVRPATNWTPETSESVTASNLLAWAGAPAGWWTNHPYVNVAGVSNGWRFWPDVASNIVWRSVIGDDSEIPDTVGVTSREWIVKGEFGPTAQDAYDNTVAASWIGNGDSFGSDRWSSYEDYGSGAGSNRWYCRMEAQSREYAVEHGFPFAAALDVWCLLNSSLYSSTYGTNVVFDSIDDGLSTNTYTKVYSETIAASAAWSGGFLLSTNFDTAMPYWGESGEIVVGWSLETYGINGVGWWAWLKKYNATTNGFKWFR